MRGPRRPRLCGRAKLAWSAGAEGRNENCLYSHGWSRGLPRLV